MQNFALEFQGLGRKLQRIPIGYFYLPHPVCY